MSTITIHLAWNDDHGEFCGELFQVEFHDGDGHCLTLDYDPIVGLPVDCVGRANAVTIRLNDGDVTFAATNRRCWVGSMAWDSVQMPTSEAERFARHLLACDFTPTDFVHESPWREIAEVLP